MSTDRPPLRVVPPPSKGGRTTRARRRRARETEPEDAAKFVLGAANLVAGAMDLLGALSKGESVLPAAKKALRRTKKRGRALEKAYAEPDE